MKFQIRVPRFVTSTVSAATAAQTPVLDGRDVTIPNRWALAADTVALVGRPAVWSIVEIETPKISLGFTTIPSFHHTFEQDFGGHLFVIVVSNDGRHASVIEAGPVNPDGSGALVPFCYPEDDFVTEHVVDFDPLVIDPPNGFSREFFADLVRRTHRAYDGNQRYLAVEIPFFRVGRDSNSYVVGVLAACGVDARALPELRTTLRTEWTGYPGMEDPVHRANFGAYLGAPTSLGPGTAEVAYHDESGDIRYAVVGGDPYGNATLPDGTKIGLDCFGRKLFAPDDARAHGIPTTHTEPPEEIAKRIRFPAEAEAAGAEITLIVDGRSVSLVPGSVFEGRVESRNDALNLATLRTRAGATVVLPLAELGVELRDPKRVDALLREGNDVRLGLRSDRHPQLVSRGRRSLNERMGVRRFHAPQPLDIARATAATVLGLGIVAGLGAGIYARFTRR